MSDQPPQFEPDDTPVRLPAARPEKSATEQVSAYMGKAAGWVGEQAEAARKRAEEARAAQEERERLQREEEAKAQQDSELIYDHRRSRARAYVPPDISSDLLTAFLTNQKQQVGELIDYWGQTLPTYGEKATEFWVAWKQFMDASSIRNASYSWRYLPSTGMMSKERGMIFVRRGGATVTVYIATQGKDLFVSLRSFIQTPINPLVVLGIIGVSLLIAFLIVSLFFPSSFGFYSSGYNSSTQTTAFVIAFLVSMAVQFGLAQATGRLYLPPSNLYLDDVVSLASTAHQAIVAAVDLVGIEEVEITPYQPQPMQGWQRRF